MARCRAIERCNASSGASGVTCRQPGGVPGRGVESNPHWTMGGEHSGAGPAVAVAVLPRRAHRGPPWPWCDRFDPIPLPPGLMLRHARQPFDLRVRPRFDVSGMCSDTAMRPRRRDNRGHTTSEDAAQKRCSSSAGRVCKASSLTGMRSNLESQDEQPQFLLVMALWWACQDLNQRPHPYQRSTVERCANRPFRWLCDSVRPIRMG